MLAAVKEGLADIVEEAIEKANVNSQDSHVGYVLL